MIRTCSKIVITVSMVLFFAAIGRADDKIDGLAKEAAEKFAKAFQDKNVEGMLAVSDVPFCEDGKKIFKTKEELKELFEKVVKREGAAEFKFKVSAVGTLDQMEEKAGKKIPDERREKVLEALGKEHRVVLLEITMGDRTDKAALGLRISDGKAKVVTVID
jgi:hypothetical protein